MCSSIKMIKISLCILGKMERISYFIHQSQKMQIFFATCRHTCFSLLRQISIWPWWNNRWRKLVLYHFVRPIRSWQATNIQNPSGKGEYNWKWIIYWTHPKLFKYKWNIAFAESGRKFLQKVSPKKIRVYHQLFRQKCHNLRCLFIFGIFWKNIW